MDVIWYSAQEKTLPKDISEQTWKSLTSGTPQVKEFVTLDGMLCPDFKFKLEDDDWNYIVMNGEFLTDLYTNPVVFLSRNIDLTKYNILACIKEPKDNERSSLINDYEFIGYDLIDKTLTNSALTNSGGGFEYYSPANINKYGIFTDRDLAYKVRDELVKSYPEDRL